MAKFLSTFTSTAQMWKFPRISVDKMPLRNLGGWITSLQLTNYWPTRWVWVNIAFIITTLVLNDVLDLFLFVLESGINLIKSTLRVMVEK